MAKIDTERHERFINKLCYRGEKVIDSEKFGGVQYVIKDGHLCIMANKDGQLAVSFEKLKAFIKEIEEICDCWADVKTKKCIL